MAIEQHFPVGARLNFCSFYLGIYKKPVATGRGSGGFKYSIVPGKPSESILIHRMKSLDPGIMMPESGRALADKEAIEMLEEWIINL